MTERSRVEITSPLGYRGDIHLPHVFIVLVGEITRVIAADDSLVRDLDTEGDYYAAVNQGNERNISPFVFMAQSIIREFGGIFADRDVEFKHFRLFTPKTDKDGAFLAELIRNLAQYPDGGWVDPRDPFEDLDPLERRLYLEE